MKKTKKCNLGCGPCHIKRVSVSFLLIIAHMVGILMVVGYMARPIQSDASEEEPQYLENFEDIAYYDQVNSTADWSLGGLSYSSGGVLGSAGFSTNSRLMSATISPNDHIYVVYSDVDRDKKATVMKYTGNTTSDNDETINDGWEYVGSPAFSAGEVVYPSIVIGSDEVPYVVYNDSTQGYRDTAMKFNDATDSWELVGAAGFSDVGMVGNVAMDSNGVLYKGGYLFGNNYYAMVMKFDGSGWVEVGENIAYYKPRSISLAIDKNDVPHMLYSDGDNGYRATVVKFDEISEEWGVVGSAGFSLGGVRSYGSCLVFDSSNVPYVAFGHRKINVMRYSENMWENVGELDFSIGTAYNPSLVFDSDDNLYVAYTDSGDSYKSHVKSFNGSYWEDIDDLLSPARADYPDLLVDSSDNLYVTYIDQSNSNKLSAKRGAGNLIQSLTIDDSDNNIISAVMTVVGSDLDGTRFYLTNDGGLTWSEVDSGVVYEFDIGEVEDWERSDLRWRVVLSSPDARITEISISYIEESTVVASRRDTTPPGLVTNASASLYRRIDDTVLVSWANPEDSDLGRVYLYRGSEPNFELTSPITSFSNGQTTYLDRSVSMDTTYYYALITADTYGNINQEAVYAGLYVYDIWSLLNEVEEGDEVEDEDAVDQTAEEILENIGTEADAIGKIDGIVEYIAAIIEENNFSDTQVTILNGLVEVIESIYDVINVTVAVSEDDTVVDSSGSGDEEESEDGNTGEDASVGEIEIEEGPIEELSCEITDNDVTLNKKLYKAPSSTTVYLEVCNKLRVFGHQNIYQGWGYDTFDWSDITIISENELGEYEQDLPVAVRPGTLFTVNGNTEEVYVAGKEGMIYPFESIQLIEDFYGIESAESYVVRMPEGFIDRFSGFVKGETITDENVRYFDGMLFSAGENVYIVQEDEIRLLPLDIAKETNYFLAKTGWVLPRLPINLSNLSNLVFGPAMTVEEINTIIPVW